MKQKGPFVGNCLRVILVLALAGPAGLWLTGPSPAGEEVRLLQGLVRVDALDPSIVVEMRYASSDNFTGKKIYPYAICLLNEGAARKLVAANAEFRKDGYRIKVWDAYRPPYVQKIFWGILPDDRYVANPYKGGSRHNRGGAVDLTLVDADGKELEMPTAFDDFSEKASPSSPAMSPEARKNSEYLSRVMRNNGFLPYEHEWWHFDDSRWRDFPLVDVKLEHFLFPVSDATRVLSALGDEIQQAVVVRSSAGSSQAQVTGWERTSSGWQVAGDTMKAVVGRNGVAPLDEKREGDGRTPSGIYRIGTAFGYARTGPTGLAYRQATEQDFWVDDPRSSQYNEWVRGTPKAASYELMRRKDELYKYGIVIEYNTRPVTLGRGSAIFFHIWRGEDQPTAGCVALAETDLLKLLSWLHRNKSPVVIISG